MINWNGSRVLGVLATSRSIGNKLLKRTFFFFFIFSFEFLICCVFVCRGSFDETFCDI